MRPVILYRGDDFVQNELGPAVDAGFSCVSHRTEIKKNDLVIGRYSVLPFYKELEEDLVNIGAKLINTYQQHLYIADMKNWYKDLEYITPTTYFEYTDVPFSSQTGYVVKGCTNSKKFEWNRSMFVPPSQAVRLNALMLAEDLRHDGLLSSQQIYIREYVPLKTFMKGLYDLPITNEFRFFTLDGKILSGGFYWSNYVDDIKEKIGRIPNKNDVPRQFIQDVLTCIKGKTRAVVVDVAETASGDWIVIELNDLQMSGLSENNPNTLYENLFDNLREI